MTGAPPSDSAMRRFGSLALGAALIGLAGWIAQRNLRLPANDGWMFWVPISSLLVTMGLLSWWTAFGGSQPGTRARIRASWRMGWRLGAIGLGLGFVGPLLISPGASLGPLLGILITGPAGFVLGALGAAVVSKDPGT